MEMYKKMGFRKRLLIFVLVVGIAPLLVMGIISLKITTDSLSEQTTQHLVAVREIKKAQIEGFYTDSRRDLQQIVSTIDTVRQESIKTLRVVLENRRYELERFFRSTWLELDLIATDATLQKVFKDLKRAFIADGKRTDGPQWKAMAEKYYPIMEQFNITDISNTRLTLVMVTEEGDVIYTEENGSDLGENLLTGHLQDSPLGRCFKKALHGMAFTDFNPYAPYNNDIYAFAGIPISAEDGVIGVVLFQLPIFLVAERMRDRSGLGETGEAFLVGSDKLMRSDSHYDLVNRSVKGSFRNPEEGMVDTPASREALAGNEGADVLTNYLGKYVLSCYTPIDIFDVRWALIVEIDITEALCPKDDAGTYLLEKQIKNSDFQDLYLVNPDGYAFYSVAQKADYQSNLLSGEYSDSNLGRLVRQVFDSKEFGIADFELYAPNDNMPSAFVAQPVLHDDKVDLIVATQISLGALGSIMQERSGMGKTGETYLVGPDKLMRSDSYLNPTDYSVVASFKNPDKGKVDTEAVREALSGKTDQKIIIDYNGNPVLSAFTPLNIEGLHWALIAEIDESEAFATARKLKWLMVIVAIVSIISIAGCAFYFSGSMKRPLDQAATELKTSSEELRTAAQQQLTSSTEQATEVTQLSTAMEEMSSSFKQIMIATSDTVSSAEQTSALSGTGMASLDKSVEGMDRIKKQVENVVQNMLALNDKTQQMNVALRIIRELADQTTILSYNATIEAAAAGEEGRRFSALAEQIMKLANKATESTKEVSSLIDDIQKSAGKTVLVTEDGMKAVSEGFSHIKETRENFNEIIVSAESNTTSAKEIEMTISQQANAVEQATEGIKSVGMAAEQIKISSEQTTSAADKMFTVTKKLE